MDLKAASRFHPTILDDLVSEGGHVWPSEDHTRLHSGSIEYTFNSEGAFKGAKSV